MIQYRIGLFGKREWISVLLEKLIYDKKFNISFICFNNKNEINKIEMINNLNIPQFTIIEFDKKNLKKIKQFNCDYLISVSYLKKFPIQFINNFKNNSLINIHSSLLPKYKGRSILNWQLINGEKVSGLTSHFINEKIDSGKIIYQIKYLISINDDYLSLFIKSSSSVYKLLKLTLKTIEKKKFSFKNNSKITKCYRKRIYGDEIFVPNKITFSNLYNFIRALKYPGPFATILIKRRKYRIYSIEKINYKQSDIKNNLIVNDRFIIAKLKDCYCKLFYLDEKN